jgi:TolB protein
MQEDGGLAPGRYNWELLVEGELMGGGAFVVGAPTTGTPGPEVTSTAARVQGPRIVFVSLRDRNNELYIVNPDGTGVVRLTNNSDVDYDPACSPDGGRIAFMSARDGNTEIYVMNTDGRGATRLTNNPDVDISPTWSPDGSRIAFVSYTGTNGEIYVMNSDGSGVVRVTNNPADDWDPTWCAR